ncbi:MAG TPA: hypothetical protein VK922_08545 [Gemmatimonadaceae bacterium]|nr:hypothetical protein [Gemmatimonadaceae bacterium]
MDAQMLSTVRVDGNRGAANLVSGTVRVYRSLDFFPPEGATVQSETRDGRAGGRR